ncbi:MAG: cache domain-containing protein [Patescibacteria group bacterium]
MKHRPFYISGLFLIFSVVFLFIFFNKTSRDSLVEQIQYSQQLSARMEASSIESYVNSIGRMLLIISDDPSQDELDRFIETWFPMGILGITLSDKDGMVIKASNTINVPDLGENISDRDYFKWAQKTKSREFRAFAPIVSKRGPNKDTYIVPVATSLFSVDNKFNGVLIIGISLSNLSKDYLNNPKILDSTKIYLVTNSGEIIYSDYPELIRKNFKDVFTNNFLGKNKVMEIILDNLKKNDESKLELAIPGFGSNFRLEPYLISVSPIHISDQLWNLVMITPEKDLNVFTYKIYSRQIFILFVVFVVFIALTIKVFRKSDYEEAVKNEHKIHGID